jgi:hypothetical protein
MTTETTTGPNGDKAKQSKQRPTVNKPRVISNPNDVASLVLMQIDAVNAKKDDLTIAIKGLADLAKQLVRAYAQNAQAIQKLQTRVQALEKEKQK